MLKQFIVLLFITLSLFAQSEAQFQTNSDLDRVYNETIKAYMKDDKTVTEFVYKSHAYVVFPTVGKGGALIGGAYGEGRAFIGGRYVANVILNQYTVGIQAGGQQYSEIIFFKTVDAFEKFKKDGFQYATQMSVVPLYSGLSGDVNFAEDVQVFTSSAAGLMLEITTGFQNFTYIPLK